MAPQKRYGTRPRQEPLFSISPYLRTSSPKQRQDIVVEELTHRINDFRVQTPVRAVLAPKDGNERSSRQNHRSQGKPKIATTGTDHLPELISKLTITSSPKKPVAIQASTHFTAPLLALSSEAVTTPTLFSVWSSTIEQYFDIVKIAEASYGEVYRLVLNADHPDFSKSDESVLKVLALRGPPEAKPSKAQCHREALMSAVDNVAAEVKLLQRMADNPGFTHFRDIRVLKGKPSLAFAKAWKKFNDNQPDDDKSQFPDPSKKTSYTNQQHWAVIEMQDAGVDLEHFHLRNVFSVWDVFWGVTLTLARGEQDAEFEHRDLHMGNICVKSTRRDELSGAEEVKEQKLNRKLGFTNLETTIIDYTLSRAITSSTDDKVAEVEFLDLATDPALFEGQGDYQYDMYRRMRDLVGDSNWADFHPITNLVWLHFILHEMLNSPHFSWPLSTKRHTHSMKGFPAVHGASSNVKRITSPKAIRTSRLSHDKVRHAKERDLACALKKLSNMLEDDDLGKFGLDSATSLVCFALERGWLDESDVVGEGDTSLSMLLTN